MVAGMGAELVVELLLYGDEALIFDVELQLLVGVGAMQNQPTCNVSWCCNHVLSYQNRRLCPHSCSALRPVCNLSPGRICPVQLELVLETELALVLELVLELVLVVVEVELLDDGEKVELVLEPVLGLVLEPVCLGFSQCMHNHTQCNGPQKNCKLNSQLSLHLW